MRHVYPDDPPGLSYCTRREKTIKARPAAEIKDGFART